MRRRDFLGVLASTAAVAVVGLPTPTPTVGFIRISNNAIIRGRNNGIDNLDVQLLEKSAKNIYEFYNRHVHHHAIGPSKPPSNVDLLVFL